MQCGPIPIARPPAPCGPSPPASNHGQPGDPEKLAKVLVDFVDAPNPPVRLPLGSDAVAAIEAKHVGDAAILAEWRSVVLGQAWVVSVCQSVGLGKPISPKEVPLFIRTPGAGSAKTSTLCMQRTK